MTISGPILAGAIGCLVACAPDANDADDADAPDVESYRALRDEMRAYVEELLRDV